MISKFVFGFPQIVEIFHQMDSPDKNEMVNFTYHQIPKWHCLLPLGISVDFCRGSALTWSTFILISRTLQGNL
jgi:hypothetical protein